MELEFALLADAANISRELKLNITGEFNTIFAQTVPITWPRMTFVARLNAHVAEGSKHTAILVMNDADGDELFRSQGFPLEFTPAGPGRPLRAGMVINLDGMTFRKYGDYEINLLVDGRLMGSAPIYVTPPPGAGRP